MTDRSTEKLLTEAEDYVKSKVLKEGEFVFDSYEIDAATALISGLSAKLREREWQEAIEGNLPVLEDNSVLVHFENGSIETVHIEDFFKPITNGLDEDGKQMYTKGYLHHDPVITHWQILPAPPKKEANNEK